MTGFDIAIKFVLKQEGGLVDDPNDPGGMTNFGISKTAHPSVDIKNLTREEAISIYRSDYWDAVKADHMPRGIAIFVFDSVVQHGIKTAVEWLQTAVGAKADGDVGPKTLEAVKKANNGDTLRKIGASRMKFYGDDYRFKMYGTDWSRRMMDCFFLSCRWLDG